MDVASARDCFPGLQDKVFLDAACVSLMPTQAQAALDRLAGELMQCPARDASAHHSALDRTRATPVQEAARLIGAEPKDIALIESTTHGLEAVAAAIPLARGDRILIGDLEFLGVAVPWIPRRQRDGIVIDVIPSRDGRLHADDYARAIDARTRLVLLSSVQWSNGYRADLPAFCELAERHGVVLVVDAIQQLGAIGFDVRQTPVDFLIAGGHKWLNAPVGRGFMYVHPRIVERYAPPWWGYLNIAEPEAGWAAYFGTPSVPAVRDYEFAPGARRFELGGTSNYPGNVALGASLALINELGIGAIEAHILELTELLVEGLRAAGAVVVSPQETGARSGITTFTLGQGPSADRALLDFLLDRRILVSQRYTAGVGGIRVSTHFFNNGHDLRQLVDAVQAFPRI